MPSMNGTNPNESSPNESSPNESSPNESSPNESSPNESSMEMPVMMSWVEGKEPPQPIPMQTAMTGLHRVIDSLQFIFMQPDGETGLVLEPARVLRALGHKHLSACVQEGCEDPACQRRLTGTVLMMIAGDPIEPKDLSPEERARKAGLALPGDFSPPNRLGG